MLFRSAAINQTEQQINLGQPAQPYRPLHQRPGSHETHPPGIKSASASRALLRLPALLPCPPITRTRGGGRNGYMLSTVLESRRDLIFPGPRFAGGDSACHAHPLWWWYHGDGEQDSDPAPTRPRPTGAQTRENIRLSRAADGASTAWPMAGAARSAGRRTYGQV